MLRIIAALAALLISSAAIAGNSSLSNLTAAGAVSSTDLFYDVQTAGVGGVKVTALEIASFVDQSGTACPVVGGIVNYGLFANTTGAPTGTVLNIFDTSQCVPWATLNQTAHTLSWRAQIASSPSGTIGSSGSFWISSGSARINNIQDRLFVGAAAAVNTGNAPESPSDWLNTLIPSTTQNAQFVSINTIGLIGIIGAARSSDYTAAQQLGTIGLAGYGINDNTSFADSAWGVYGEAHRNSSVTGLTLADESEVQNNGSTVDISPNGFATAGLTASYWAGCGASAGTGPCSAALGILDNGQKFRKGIVFKSSALATALGAGGSGVAIELAIGQSIRWLDGAGATAAELYGSASGLNIADNALFSGWLLPQLNSNGTFPPTGNGGAIAWNFTAASGELDFWNTYTAAGDSFRWYQQTGVGAATLLADLGTGGFNSVAIGQTTAAAGAFTTLSASSTVSGSGFSNYLASPPAIGGTAPAAGTFTALRFNSSISANGSSGLTQTCTVNQAKTLIFTLGILTGGTCNT